MIPCRSIRYSIFCLFVCAPTFAFGQETAIDDTEFFESNIRPTLVKHCYECHSVEKDSAESGLTLDTREGLRRGGDRGPTIVLGRPDESLLIKAVSHSDPDLQMPPDDREIAGEIDR